MLRKLFDITDNNVNLLNSKHAFFNHNSSNEILFRLISISNLAVKLFSKWFSSAYVQRKLYENPIGMSQKPKTQKPTPKRMIVLATHLSVQHFWMDSGRQRNMLRWHAKLMHLPRTLVVFFVKTTILHRHQMMMYHYCYYYWRGSDVMVEPGVDWQCSN